MGMPPPKVLGVAEADVVDQEDDDVGRALRRLHLEARRRLGVARVELGLAGIVGLRNRKHRAIDSRRASAAARDVSFAGCDPLQPIPARRASTPPKVTRPVVLLIVLLIVMTSLRVR